MKHYLLDFGSTLGSGSVKPQTRRAGNEYIIEGKPIAKAGLTLGIWDRPWRHVKYPDYPAIGRFEADFFQPQLWKPEYPNPAFERMQLTDAFWTTRTVLRFTDEMIRAIVETGQISDPEASNYLVETLIKRRDKIIRYYLPRMNPLDDFQLTGEPGFYLEVGIQESRPGGRTCLGQLLPVSVVSFRQCVARTGVSRGDQALNRTFAGRSPGFCGLSDGSHYHFQPRTAAVEKEGGGLYPQRFPKTHGGGHPKRAMSSMDSL